MIFFPVGTVRQAVPKTNWDSLPDCPYKRTNMHKLFSTIILLLILLFSSCKEDDGGGMTNPCDHDFDEKAMYQNLADNLIIPAYADLQSKVTIMAQKAGEFTSQQDELSLGQLRTAWREAYLVWQVAAQFEFGPAETVFLRNSLNNFPADSAAIEANVASGTYDFDQPEAFDKGFPAMDYLLYGVGETPAEVVAFFSGQSGTKYRQYVSDLVDDIKQRVDKTHTEWTIGNYRQAFIDNTGTAAGTSLSLVINNLNQNYELIKRDKLGIPSGILTLGFTNPKNVEAFYLGISIELATAAVEASKQFFLGNNLSGTVGLGVDDFLKNKNAEKNGQPLDAIITTQFDAAIAAINALNNPLSETVDTNNAAVVNAYNEVTKQVVNLKTDLPSVLCVSITYVDNPSDSD